MEFSSANHSIFTVKDIGHHDNIVFTRETEIAVGQQLGAISERSKLVVGIVVDVEMCFAHVSHHILVSFQRQKNFSSLGVFGQTQCVVEHVKTATESELRTDCTRLLTTTT